MDRIWTQVDARFSPFGHPVQINKVKLLQSLLKQLISQWNTGHVALKWVGFFYEFHVPVRKLGGSAFNYQCNFLRKFKWRLLAILFGQDFKNCRAHPFWAGNSYRNVTPRHTSSVRLGRNIRKHRAWRQVHSLSRWPSFFFPLISFFPNLIQVN